MSSPLPSNAVAYEASTYFSSERKALIIANITIFSVYFVIQVPMFIRQKSLEPGNKSIGIYLWSGYRDLINLFLMMRIAGNAVYLAAEHSSNAKNLLIGAAILSGIGTTPLLAETARFVLRCFHAEGDGPRNAIHKQANIASKISLGLVILCIIFSSVGQSIQKYALTKVGIVLIVAIFFVLLLSSARILIQYKFATSRIQKAFMIASAVFPFLAVRVIYAVLGGFEADGGKFSSFSGNVRIAAGMQLAMEVICITIYMVARLVLVPIGKRSDEEIASQHESQRFNAKEVPEIAS